MRPGYSRHGPSVRASSVGGVCRVSPSSSPASSTGAQLVGSTTGDLTAGSNPDFGEAGLNLLDLRHLGVDRTLVLVDGRRHVSGLAGSAAVDIDSIPTDLLESVDVLTGGASAVYGADGVSGVVNFRLKKNFEGISFRGQTGVSGEGDGNNTFVALTAGMNFADDRGNFALAYEYSADDRVDELDRDYLRPPRASYLYQNQDDLDDDPNVPDLVPYNDGRYADSSPTGAVDVDFDYASDFEGNGAVYDRGFLLENSGGYTQGGSSTPVDGYQGDLFPDLDKHLVNLVGHFDVSDSLTISGEAKYVRSHAMSVAQPSYDFYLFMTPDNPYMPQAIRDAIVPGAAAAWFEDDSVPDGVIVFPVPQAVAWLVIGGVLAMCCALLTLVSAGRATRRRMPVRRAGRFRPTQPQPQQL